MELNKRKSLLSPASPTVWGMIHGDISKQEDLTNKITEIVNAISSGLTNKIKSDILAEINPMLGEALEQTQPLLVSGENIRTLSGRSLLGHGDIDPLDEGDRMLLETIETKADMANTYTKTEVNDLLANVEIEGGGVSQDEFDNLKTDVTSISNQADQAYLLATSALQEIGSLNTTIDDIIGV